MIARLDADPHHESHPHHRCADFTPEADQQKLGDRDDLKHRIAFERNKVLMEGLLQDVGKAALTDEAMFRTFAREIKAPLLANMTEFGRTPYFTAAQFEEFGYKMIIWPVSSLRIAAKAVDDLYACLAREGSATTILDRM